MLLGNEDWITPRGSDSKETTPPKAGIKREIVFFGRLDEYGEKFKFRRNLTYTSPRDPIIRATFTPVTVKIEGPSHKLRDKMM